MQRHCLITNSYYRRTICLSANFRVPLPNESAVLSEVDKAWQVSLPLNLSQWPTAALQLKKSPTARKTFNPQTTILQTSVKLLTGHLLSLSVIWISQPLRFVIRKYFPDPRKAIFMCQLNVKCMERTGQVQGKNMNARVNWPSIFRNKKRRDKTFRCMHCDGLNGCCLASVS